MNLPIDQSAQLIHAILVRRSVKVFRRHHIHDKDAPSLADRMRAILDTTANLE
jgi:hypothetical protein